MEEKIDTMIALLTEIRDALNPPSQVESDCDTETRCPCVQATGVPIGNCPFCRGGG